MLIRHRKSCEISENRVTADAVYLNRRSLMKAAGIGALSIAGGSLMTPRPAHAQMADANAGLASTGDLYPAPLNEGIREAGRALTDESVATTYNNFYEFGSHKQIWKAAQALQLDPWNVQIDGLVEEPMTIGAEDLIRKMPLEERIYRHRCVEAWAMTVPWSGFQMSELVKLAKPTSDAKYIRFETFEDPKVAPGQRSSWNPWPYVEGITIDEAMNELAFVVTGAYGKPLHKQFGAPLRLALPWKYGFKHIKSFVKISFVAERPVSFWEQINAGEYGFWANVNPGVPHPRWRQDRERLLGAETYEPTLMFNGYAEQVAGLYKDLEASEGQALYR
ncbi:MAG: protein-methionine-sulfoxide reductase catalytic subunit MsrP [Pseudomonadota bacterium]